MNILTWRIPIGFGYYATGWYIVGSAAVILWLLPDVWKVLVFVEELVLGIAHRVVYDNWK